MKIEQEAWSIADFVKEKAVIQVAPAWQRGPAWTSPRQVLLIDSILRGLDIPKIYLKVRQSPNAYTYDAVDGQQRLNAIWLFRENQLPLKHPETLDPIDGIDVNGMTFSSLPKKLRDHFDAFPVMVAKIVESDLLEISRLFARLQQGVPLNPAELRNAMLGPIRNEVEAIALSHEFFAESRIPTSRYRRQDYVAHIFALAAHGEDRDIKAPNLKHLYQEFDHTHTNRIMKIGADVNRALEVLASLNRLLGFGIRHKWIVVDLAWLVVQRHREKKKLSIAKLAEEFRAFDELRRQFTKAPEKALSHSKLTKAQQKQLYNYLTAFKLQGGTKASIAARSQALSVFCPI